MRALFGSLAAAGMLAAVAVAPAFAELEFCLIDPPVVVDGTTLQVGFYTHDAALARGGIAGPIMVVIHAERGSRVTTDPAAWSAHHPTAVVVLNDLRRRGGDTETVEFDALVPAASAQDSVSIRVQLPDGSARVASGRSDAPLRLRVEVPVRRRPDRRVGDQQ